MVVIICLYCKHIALSTYLFYFKFYLTCFKLASILDYIYLCAYGYM